MKENPTVRGFGRRVGGFGLLVLALAAAGCKSRHTSAATASDPVDPVPMVEAVRVESHKLNITVPLPGELQPFEEVRVFPKVTGFVQWIAVDRGSRIRKGQLLAVLVAPELAAQKAEAEAKLRSAESQRMAGEAKLTSDEGTYQRLKSAAATPGVISDEELEVAEKTAEADRAHVVALERTTDAAQAGLRALQEIAGYLRITAPFDGVVTKRNVHPGALVGPSGGPGSQSSMLRLEEVSHLRLVVAVPEIYVAGVARGARVSFTVPAFPGRTFTGVVSRLAESIDPETRTMPVEMDVSNPNGDLYSGMFPEVQWPVERREPTLFVPQSAIMRTAQGTFVVALGSGKAQWVTVKLGAETGKLTEIFGEIAVGDEIALRPTEDLRPGVPVTARE